MVYHLHAIGFPCYSRRMADEKALEDSTSGDQPKTGLSEVAYKALMDMLHSGELAPDEVVTERQIALQLGISRTPLREAVRRLEGERLLVRQRSGALVVRSLQIEEYMHILNVRRVVEGEAARLAAGRVPRVELDRLKARINEALALPEDAITPEFSTSDRDLHALVATASGNPVLQQVIADLKTRTSMVRFGRLPERRQAVCAEHLEIIDSLLAGDAQRSQQAMQFHIDQVRLTILARLGGQ
jgi:DNA-binding GntR family transcriptional regulator